MTKKEPLVCIVIVNWNSKDVTSNCLKSLKKTDYKNYKVILVDNGSTDKSVDYLKKIIPQMHLILLKKNYGYTTGTNIGWKYALKKLKADYICAMDNDIVTIQKEWLSLLVKELEKSPLKGIASGRHLSLDGTLQTPYEGAEKDSNKPDKGNYNHIKEVKAFVGPCILIKKEVIKKIGYYDENFFYGPNDLDYCYRANKAGFKVVYNGFSKSVHIGSFSGSSSSAKDWIYRNQSESMMIFSFRYDSFFSKAGMVLRQFLRAFVTRKNTIKERKFSNLYFHKTFVKRVYYYFPAVINALKSYKKTKETKIPEAEALKL